MSAFVITRQFKANKQQVFDAWAHAEKMVQWWGPKGFITTAKTFELKPKGIFHYSFQSNTVGAMWGKFVYQYIKAPEKMVFNNSFSDEQGNITRAPFSADWPLEITNTLTLEEESGITTLTLEGSPVNATPEEQKTFESNLENMKLGFAGTFDRLEEFLAKQ